MGSKLKKIAKERLPFIIATGGEFIALYFWLYYFDLEQYALATILLWFGFLVERIAVLYWVKENFGDDVGLAGKQKPLWKKALGLFLICASEITVWVVFVLVYDWYGFWPAFAVVFVGEQLEHSWELSLLSETSIKNYLFSWDATFITILEAFGGIMWLYLVRHEQSQLGGAMLLLGLTVEHVIQGNAIKKKLQSKDKNKASESSTTEPSPDASAGAQPVPQT